MFRTDSRQTIHADLVPPGGNLNAASRQALMQKLARIEPAPVAPQPMFVLLLLGINHLNS